MTKSGTIAGATSPVTDGSSWRAILMQYALAVRSAQGNGDARVELSQGEQKNLALALGPMAEEALRIVEDFAAGAALARGTAVGDDTDSQSRFSARLAIILNGLEPLHSDAAHQASLLPQLIQIQLWNLLQMARESAELSYAREIELVELDRRILLMLSDSGPLVPADISSSAGVDKAQVSRSVKRLLELRMVERKQIRSPVSLTRKGQAVSDRLDKLAEFRHRELVFGIDDAELNDFFHTLEKLLGQAIILYEQERARGTAPDAQAEAKADRLMEEGGSLGKLAFNRRRVLAPLLTLSAYFTRSGSLTFKRLTRLSSFEAQVLHEIGIDPPVEWSVLVSRLDRDHSQAARTVNGLVERGLVTRHGKPGRRHGRFSPTAAGMKLVDVIQQAGRQRNDFLLAPLSPGERASFMATFETIKRNATVQLERERAYDEMERA